MKVIENKLLIIFMVIIVVLTIISIPDDSKMGEIYFKSYKVDEAYEYYKKSDQGGERSFGDMQKLKDFYLAQGDLEKALNMQIKVSTILPNSKTELYALEELYRWTNKRYQSLQIKEKIAMLEKDESIKNSMLLEISYGYRWLRKYTDLERLNKYLVANGQAESLDASLEFYISTANYIGIISLTNKLKKEGELTKDLLLLRAQSFEILGEFQNSMNAYSEILFFGRADGVNRKATSVPDARFYSKNLGLYEKIIDLYGRLGDSEQLAILFENIIAVKKDEYEIAFDLSDLFQAIGKFEDQKRILLDLYETRKPNVLFRAADTLRAIGDYESSLKFLRKLLQIRPNNLNYNQLISEVYEDSGQLKEALVFKYKIRKILERKIPKITIFYPHFWWTDIIAQSSGTQRVSKLKNDLRSNHKSIIYLLQRLEDKKNILKELKLYNLRYPLDLEMKNLLADLYTQEGDFKKARQTYEDVLEQNYLDRTAALYIIDNQMNNASYDEALQVIERFPNKYSDAELLNRSFNIYEITDNQKLSEVCRKARLLEDDLLKNFSLTDLRARCSELEKDFDLAQNFYLSYIQANPEEFYPKLALGYFYLRNEKVLEAQLVYKDLETSPNQIEVQKFRNAIKLEVQSIARRNALEIRTFYEYFMRSNDKRKFTRYSLTGLKNVEHNAFGLGLGVQDPIFPSSYIGDVSLLYRYSKETLTFDFSLGNNVVNDIGLFAVSNLNYKWNSNLTIGMGLEYNRQIYELVNLVDDVGATKDTIGINLYYLRPQKNEGYINLEFSQYLIDQREDSSSYLDGAFQYDFFISPRILLGPYFFVHRTVNDNTFPENVIADKNTVVALHGRYIHRPESRTSNISNISDVYLGSDLETESSSSPVNYFNLLNKTIYKTNEEDYFEFEAQISKQLFVDEDDTVFRAKLTYNVWYY